MLDYIEFCLRFVDKRWHCSEKYYPPIPTILYKSKFFTVAGILRLHREETYSLPPHATADEIVSSESARRTFWVIQDHDNLYTQLGLPLGFAKSDITTLLPCGENDFAFGRVPTTRAAVTGTPPAIKEPGLASIPSRSLFATLIQSHDLWGIIARDAYRDESSTDRLDFFPWDKNSRYTRVTSMLQDWEDNMPAEHRWSPWNLRGFKGENLELVRTALIRKLLSSSVLIELTKIRHTCQFAPLLG